MSKYVPPHLRQGNKSASKLMTWEEIVQLPCNSRCKEWMKEGESVCGHHKFMWTSRTATVVEYFASHSDDIFMSWLRAKRQPGEGHPLINQCFEKKNFGSGERYSSAPKSIEDLFTRFLRYAADIDNGTEFVEKARKIALTTEDFSFLDIGFAPGGMAALLLDVDQSICGIGINLDPEKGGNVYPSSMESSRFHVLTRDVIELARDSSLDFLELFPKSSISKFNFVIIGITTSGSNQKQVNGMDELELKDLLHFSQLLLAFKFLKRGGAILMRIHLGLRLVDLHILSLILDHFSGQPVVSKPLTEFAMRKTFWLYVDGFEPSEEALERLSTLVKSGSLPAYAASANEQGSLNNSILVTYGIDELLKRHGTHIVKLLSPMWLVQTKVLHAIMDGKRERCCYRCRTGASICYRCRNSVPGPILLAIRNVKLRIDRSNVENLSVHK